MDTERKLLDEIDKVFVRQKSSVTMLFYVSGVDIDDLQERLGIVGHQHLDAWYFDEDSCQKALVQTFSCQYTGRHWDWMILRLWYDRCRCMCLNICMRHRRTLCPILRQLNPYSTGKYMLLDSATRRNLELTETMREKQKRGSLLWVLDKTKTAMGARLLRTYLEQPLIEQDRDRATSGCSRRSE